MRQEARNRSVAGSTGAAKLECVVRALVEGPQGLRVDGAHRWVRAHEMALREAIADAQAAAMEHASPPGQAEEVLSAACERLRALHHYGDARAFLVGSGEPPAGRFLDLASTRRRMTLLGGDGSHLDVSIALERTGDALQPVAGGWALEKFAAHAHPAGVSLTAVARRGRGAVPPESVLEGLDLENYGVHAKGLLDLIRRELGLVRALPDDFDRAWRRVHRRWASESDAPWAPLHAGVEETLAPIMAYLSAWHDWRARVQAQQCTDARRHVLVSLSLLSRDLWGLRVLLRGVTNKARNRQL